MLRPGRPGPGRFAAAQFAVPREVSRDALLEIGLDLLCGRALLDGVRRQPWLAIALTEDVVHIDGSLPRRPRGEKAFTPLRADRPERASAESSCRSCALHAH